MISRTRRLLAVEGKRKSASSMPSQAGTFTGGAMEERAIDEADVEVIEIVLSFLRNPPNNPLFFFLISDAPPSPSTLPCRDERSTLGRGEEPSEKLVRRDVQAESTVLQEPLVRPDRRLASRDASDSVRRLDLLLSRAGKDQSEAGPDELPGKSEDSSSS
jgi:hypothetical protein